jgi:hypothetical protein
MPVLHLNRATYCVDHAAEFNETSVTGALHDPPVVYGDCRVNEIAAQRSQPCQRAVLVSTGKPAVTDHIGSQDRRDFPALRHVRPLPNRE